MYNIKFMGPNYLEMRTSDAMRNPLEQWNHIFLELSLSSVASDPSLNRRLMTLRNTSNSSAIPLWRLVSNKRRECLLISPRCFQTLPTHAPSNLPGASNGKLYSQS